MTVAGECSIINLFTIKNRRIDICAMIELMILCSMGKYMGKRKADFMKCTLMNKNVLVVILELDEDTAAIIKVITPLNLTHLPVGVNTGKVIPNKKELNDWWYGRAIPASRSGIRSALEKMDMNQPKQLLTKCHGLSLSDQYWMKPENSGLSWAAINFFENNFSDEVGNILFDQQINHQEINMMSPCNTLDGWLKKGGK